MQLFFWIYINQLHIDEKGETVVVSFDSYSFFLTLLWASTCTYTCGLCSTRILYNFAHTRNSFLFFPSLTLIKEKRKHRGLESSMGSPRV